jgi:uncharacterized iron-regulated membrane protein
MRKIIVLLHRYIGLALAVFLLVSGLTGTLIVFGKAIDGFLNPALLKVVPQPDRVPIDDVLRNAQRAVPEGALRTVYLPHSADDTVEVLFQGSSIRIYANPYSGEVLGAREANKYLRGFLIDLHVHLLSGETGERVIGWAGLGAIILALLGLWLWWPRYGRWRQALSIKWQAGSFRVWFDIHRVAGVCVMPFLLMTAATGASLALYDLVTESALVAITGQGARQPVVASQAAAGPDAPIQPMLARAAAMFPDGEITRLTLPAKERDAVGVRMRLKSEVHQFGRTFLWFDRYDSKLLRVDNALTAHRAIQIQSWLFPLHTGTYGGVFTQWLQILVGLSLSLLTLSGGWLWLKRIKVKAKTSVPSASRLQVNE